MAAWLKGGHPERLGAAAIIVVFAVSFFTHPWRVGAFYVGDAALDLALTAFFVWLALRRDRWWPLVMTAVMVLTLLVHGASLALPHVGAYANVSARIGLGILSVLVLLAGAGERWLAGETAVSDLAAWRPRPPTPKPAGGPPVP